jgi:hypothetical protein
MRPGSHKRIRFTSSPGRSARTIEETKERPGSTKSVKLRVVCETCNNGWMSTIDNEAKSVLSFLILGQPAIVTLNSAKLIARWACMKMMVAEHSQPLDVCTPQYERDHLRNNREPPPNWKIWIARHDGVSWRANYVRHSGTFTFPPEVPQVKEGGRFANNTHAVTIGIGQLLIHAISSAARGVDLDIPREFMRHMCRVWPADAGFMWPPGAMLSALGVAQLAHALDTLHLHPNVRWMEELPRT